MSKGGNYLSRGGNYLSNDGNYLSKDRNNIPGGINRIPGEIKYIFREINCISTPKYLNLTGVLQNTHKKYLIFAKRVRIKSLTIINN